MLQDSSFDQVLSASLQLFDAIELCAVEELATVFETRFNVGLDFANIV